MVIIFFGSSVGSVRRPNSARDAGFWLGCNNNFETGSQSRDFLRHGAGVQRLVNIMDSLMHRSNEVGSVSLDAPYPTTPNPVYVISLNTRAMPQKIHEYPDAHASDG